MMKMDGLEVEICSENDTYYKAFITDVFTDGVSVTFENDWKPESKFSFSQVYLPSTELLSSAEYTEGQEVEVFTKFSENQAYGWWRAVLKIIKGKFYVVITVRDAECILIAETRKIRSKSNNPPIDHKTFHKFEIEVPEELREHAKMDNVHKEFQRCIGAEICRYSPDLGVLIVISRNEQSRQLSETLRKIHFRNLGEKTSLSNKMEVGHQLKSMKLIERATKMIEEGEKLLQEKKHILSFAKCPVCLEYMAAPIFQCIIGHSICNECKNKLVNCPLCKTSFTTIRNFSLEKIMENISFPCSNAEFGCEDMILLKHKVEHSKCCEYRLYDCLPGREDECRWRGKRQDILTHMEQEHKELIRKGKSNDMCDNSCFYFDDDKWKCDLIYAHGEIFWLQRYLDVAEETYSISVHYIGQKEHCDMYVYTLTFICSFDPHRKIIFGKRTHPDHVEIKDIKDKECFSIKYSILEDFKTSNVFSLNSEIMALCYNIEITKTIN